METMDFYLNDVWSKTLQVFKERCPQLDEGIFDQYIKATRLLSLSDSNAEVLCPRYIHVTILEKDMQTLEFALETVIGQHLHIVIKQEWELLEEKKKNEENSAFANRFIKVDFSEKYTFTNFIVGRSNVQAQIASLTCATNPGLVYNPLFIYGNSGLGKTHLLLAIGNKLRELYPNKQIAYISGPDFVEGVYHSSKEHMIEEFKQSFHNLDVLLVDDIQFIGGKDKTHEVFFSVFNDLVNNRKQICITADRTPSQIKGLEERIISRFNQGLNVNIEAPEYETSVNILKMKISNTMGNHQTIHDDVISYIAINFSKDVRQLEGALTRLLFYSINFAADKDEITLDTAIAAFQDSGYTGSTGKGITIDQIKKVICDYYGLTASQLVSKTRTQNIANARHIAMFLCRKMMDASYKDIGNAFGNRDHSTVINACEKVEKRIKSEDVYRQVIRDLEAKIK